MFRRLIPMGLIVVPGAALVGCLYIPGSYRQADGRPRPESQIGPPGSDKPIQIGRTTRQDVDRLLGIPAAVDESGSQTLVYHYRVRTGYVVNLCWGIGPDPDPLEDRFLRLDFDGQNLLRRYKTYKSGDEARHGT
jgi:hypothetical protein